MHIDVNKLKAKMAKREFTMYKLAKCMCIAQSTIQRWYVRGGEGVSPIYVHKAAEVLKCEIGELLPDPVEEVAA